ncbi:MAG: hypothetical protein EOM51_10310 [Clostridia bacterium]|nr:hypothetical protein [Clostridia bacterium]
MAEYKGILLMARTMAVPSAPKTYTRTYGDFKGVDYNVNVPFSRCQYMRNMYRDYTSQNGQALETRPGFRSTAVIPFEFGNVSGAEMTGIYQYEEPTRGSKIIHTAGTGDATYYVLPEDYGIILECYTNSGETVTLDYDASMVKIANSTFLLLFRLVGAGSVYVTKSLSVWPNFTIDSAGLYRSYRGYGTSLAGFISGNLYQPHTFPNKYALIGYGTKLYRIDNFPEETGAVECLIRVGGSYSLDSNEPVVTSGKSLKFLQFKDYGVCVDGDNYGIVIGNTIKFASDTTSWYVPTTYLIDATGANEAYQPVNALCPSYVRNKFQKAAAHTSSYAYNLIPPNAAKIINSIVKIYVIANDGATTQLSSSNFTFSPTAHTIVFDEGYTPPDNSEIDIYIQQSNDDLLTYARELITSKVIASYNNRIFLAGGTNQNRYYWSALNDPTYFPITNYEEAGADGSKIINMLPIGNSLALIKEPKGDNTIYIVDPLDVTEETDGYLSVIYPCKPMNTAVGGVGAAINFKDMSLYLSKYGLEMISKLDLNSERSILHCSTDIDTKLLTENLTNAVMEEWRGYLCILCHDTGHMYLGDGREMRGSEFHWLYWDGIGAYSGINENSIYPVLSGDDVVCYGVTGGTLNGATWLKEYNNELYFGAVRDGDGVVYKFNTDILKDAETRELYDIAYSDDVRLTYLDIDGSGAGNVYAFLADMYNPTPPTGQTAVTTAEDAAAGTEYLTGYRPLYGHPIQAGIATPDDSLGTISYNKTLSKRGFVALLKAFAHSKIKVRYKVSQSTLWDDMREFNSGYFDFADLDFSGLTFNVDKKVLMHVNQKVKNFVWISFLFYSDELNKPFGIYTAQCEMTIGGYSK